MDVRTSIIFLILWGILVYTITPKFNTSLEVEHRKTLKRINKAMRRIHNSNQKNMETFNFIEDYLTNYWKSPERRAQIKTIEKLEYQLKQSAKMLRDNKGGFPFNVDLQPSLEYEQFRRRIRQNTQEMWNYFNSELEIVFLNLTTKHNALSQIRNIIEWGDENRRSLLSDIDQIRLIDGYETWRRKETEDLSNLVQNRLSYIQNPVDCKNAKKILCNIKQFCGYSCQLNHVVYCLIIAYATERTLILNSKGWKYHRAGWEQLFEPVSITCTTYALNQTIRWPGSFNVKVLKLPKKTLIKSKPAYVPLAIPEDLAQRLTKLHGDPSVWWISQFLKYLLKPKQAIKKIIREKMEKLGWKRPIVGVHIRRGDKIETEADFHIIEEYMTYVEDYYLTLEINNTKLLRRIFLATDDPLAIRETRKKYPQYTIIGDQNVAESAKQYTESSIYGIISDIHMLSLSDYLVCTFSSQVCRTAYEIMQTYYPDASNRFKSLDDIYYFNGQNNHYFETILSHNPRNREEIIMKPGDLFHVAGNHWNGFSKGVYTEKENIGLYPTFKLKDLVKTVKLPTYLNVD